MVYAHVKKATLHPPQGPYPKGERWLSNFINFNYRTLEEAEGFDPLCTVNGKGLGFNSFLRQND